MNSFTGGARFARRYGSHGNFHDRLAAAEPAERAVARWFEARGRKVTILARGTAGQRGAPLLHGIERSTTAPDLLVAHPRSGRAILLEVKNKSAATWHRLTRCWTSGISDQELRRYEEAEAQSGLRCWIAFVQRGKGDRWVAKAPAPPSGLYIAPVARLREMVHHAFEVDGGAILYWRLDTDPWCRLARTDALDLRS